MPLDPNATATISVTGPALSCYNQQTSTWEVGFIRAPSHELQISVSRQLPNDVVSTFHFELDKHHQIIVETERPLAPDSPFYLPMKKFNRQVPEDIDLQDWRWVVDLEEDLNNGQPVTLKVPELPITPMFVPAPLLYADSARNVDDDAKLIRAADSFEVRDFGQFSEGAKADLSCEDGGGVIFRLKGPLGFSINLPHIPGAPPHEILIDNRCPPAAAPTGSALSDFQLYYSIVQDTGGDKFDIQLSGNGLGEGAVCNLGHLGASSKLFPLPK